MQAVGEKFPLAYGIEGLIDVGSECKGGSPSSEEGSSVKDPLSHVKYIPLKNTSDSDDEGETDDVTAGIVKKTQGTVIEMIFRGGYKKVGS